MQCTSYAKIPQKRGGTFRFYSLIAIIILLLTLSMTAGAIFGSAPLTIKQVMTVLQFKCTGVKTADFYLPHFFIVWDLRIPRSILALALALAAGGTLAVAGVAMQAITQNVLADPYILGISSGASAAVGFVFFMGGALYFSSYSIPLFAFCGAIFSLMLVYKIGKVGSSSSTRLVLAGIAVSMAFHALTQFFITIMPENANLALLVSWMMGSLAGARWNNIAVPCIGSLIGVCFFFITARAFNLISLGDETALSLGINVKRIKRMTAICVAFTTGLIVAASGIIGFVGFIIPHIIRLIAGSDHRRLFPLSFLCGGLFLIWMDILARTAFAPQEVPIGVFTALCGSPFFIWLLSRQNKNLK